MLSRIAHLATVTETVAGIVVLKADGQPFRTTPEFRYATRRFSGCRSLRFPEGCGFRSNTCDIHTDIPNAISPRSQNGTFRKNISRTQPRCPNLAVIHFLVPTPHLLLGSTIGRIRGI